MHKITKEKSTHANSWNLKINDVVVGEVEVIFLSKFSRTCKGKVSALTTSGDYPSYQFDGEVDRKIMSLAQFIANAQAAIGDADLILSTANDYVLEDREFDNIVLIEDVNEENVVGLANHLKVDLQSIPDQNKVIHLKNVLRSERDAALAIPMFDLVRKSKLPPTLGTALKYHF